MKADSMTTDIEVAQPQAVSRPANVLDLIQAAVHNPDIKPEIIREFLAIQREVEDQAAEKAFNAAFHAMQQDLPAIVKDGKAEIKKDGKLVGSYDFAHYDPAMLVIKPILRRHGFSESFLSEDTPSGVLIRLTVRHKDGHSKSSTMRAPADKTGAKNDLQALGSSQKYCWRYLIFGFLAIVCDEFKDNDGADPGDVTISSKQESEIIDMLIRAKVPEKEFLRLVGVPSIAHLPARRFDGVMTSIRAKIAKNEAEGK